MTTAQTIIKRVLRGIGVTASGEDPTADEYADSLETLNAMIDSWSVDRLFIFAGLQESFALTANQYSYTIGSSGNFNTTRPTSISHAFLRVSNIDYDLDILDDSKYAGISTKSTSTGYPQFLNYSATMPLGTIDLWPVPQAGMTLFIQSPTQLTQFATLATNVVLAPGYEEAIFYGLMMRLVSGGFGVMSPLQIELGKAAIERVKTNNSTVPVLRPEFATSRGGNIYDGFIR